MAPRRLRVSGLSAPGVGSTTSSASSAGGSGGRHGSPSPVHTRVSRRDSLKERSLPGTLVTDDDDDHGGMHTWPTLSWKGAAVAVVLLLSNVLGHYCPVLWSSDAWNTFVHHRWLLDEEKFDISQEFGGSGVFDISSSDNDIMAKGRRSLSRAKGYVGRWLQPSLTSATFAGADVWPSFFVQNVGIDVGGAKECKAVVGAAAAGSALKFDAAATALAGSNSTASGLQSIASLADLELPEQRTLVVVPGRGGLAMLLRTFTSAFVYAALSGRQLVRLHAGDHAHTWDSLCTAFHCGFAAIRSVNGSSQRGSKSSTATQLLQRFNSLQPTYLADKFAAPAALAASLSSPIPVMAVRSGPHFDAFWHDNEELRLCVFAAFQCASLWCVRSRAMYALLGYGGPSHILSNALSSAVRRVSAAPAVHAGARKAEEMSTSIPVAFDVAIHVSSTPQPAGGMPILSQHDECQDANENLRQDTSATAFDSVDEPVLPGCLRKCLWRCVESVLKTLKANMSSDSMPVDSAEGELLSTTSVGEAGKAEVDTGQRAQKPTSTDSSGGQGGLSILLVVDDDSLVPALVSRLHPYGTVFFSGSIGNMFNGVISGVELSAGGLEAMVDFFLLAKAQNVIEASANLSNFAYLAALLGNTTLATLDTGSGRCSFGLHHEADLSGSVSESVSIS